MPLVQSDAFEVTANMASVFMWGPSEASLVFEEKDLIISYLACDLNWLSLLAPTLRWVSMCHIQRKHQSYFECLVYAFPGFGVGDAKEKSSLPMSAKILLPISTPRHPLLKAASTPLVKKKLFLKLQNWFVFACAIRES